MKDLRQMNNKMFEKIEADSLKNGIQINVRERQHFVCCIYYKCTGIFYRLLPK